jgi:hypothetical protein
MLSASRNISRDHNLAMFRISWTYASLLLLVGCSTVSESNPSNSLADLPLLLEQLGKAERLELFEGLPHQNMEPDLFDRERARTQTIDFDGFSFYATPIDIDAETAAELRGLVTEASNYVAYTDDTLKACGGFHPDWLLAATIGNKTLRLHVCFGCEDFRIYADGRLVIWCEIADADRLANVLKPLRSRRPAGPPTD